MKIKKSELKKIVEEVMKEEVGGVTDIVHDLYMRVTDFDGEKNGKNNAAALGKQLGAKIS